MRTLPGITVALLAFTAAAYRSTPRVAPVPPVTHRFEPRCDPRIGIMRGDLAQAQRAARDLVDHCQVHNAPDALRADVMSVADLAHRIAEAPDLAAAARTTALMGAACGSCHVAASARLDLAIVTTPTAGEGPTTTQMRRHYWASDRMWMGLVGPSDTNWAAGAAVLRDPTAYVSQVSSRATDPLKAESLAARVADLGTQAESAHGADRVMVYGEYLGACATCHTLIPGAGF